MTSIHVVIAFIEQITKIILNWRVMYWKNLVIAGCTKPGIIRKMAAHIVTSVRKNNRNYLTLDVHNYTLRKYNHGSKRTS